MFSFIKFGVFKLFKKFRELFIILMLFYFGIQIKNKVRLGGETPSSKSELCPNLIKGPLEQDDPLLIKILRSKYIDLPSNKPYNLSHNPFYKATKESVSWPVIYNTVGKIFGGKRNGFFIEAGALDGEFLSNTLWLERKLGWTGLLIEANPLSYKKLLTKNRKVWSSNTCVSGKPYAYQSVFESISEDKHNRKSFNPWVYRGASHLSGYTAPPKYNDFFSRTSASYSTVQCFPLFSYLLALNRTEVDLLVLDIQGAEDEVIRTIPFDKLTIKVFVVEHSVKNKKFDKEFKEFFEEKGFQLIRCFGEPDYFFVLRDQFNIPEQNVTNCEYRMFTIFQQ